MARDPIDGGGYTVVGWYDISASVNPLEQKRWLAAFDLEDGSVRWCRTGADARREIVLVAPAAVVLRPVEPSDAPIEIVGAGDGQRLATLSQPAFDLTYWPRWRDRVGDVR